MKAATVICFALYILQVLSVDPSSPVVREDPNNLEVIVKQSQTSIDNMKKNDPTLQKDLSQTEESFRLSVLGIMTTGITRLGGHAQELSSAMEHLSMGMLNHSVDLTRSIAYVPYLLAVDGPVHMLKMFVMLRDVGQIPLNLRDSVDVVERYVSETQHRDIMERLVVPLSATPVNVVNTVQKFFSSLIGSMTRFWGGTQ